MDAVGDEFDDEAGDTDEPEEEEPVVTPEPRCQKRYNPAHRQLNEAKERVPAAAAGSWWARSQSREEFSKSAADLKGSRGATKVKTPLNFVE
jgi:hypothetical protein